MGYGVVEEGSRRGVVTHVGHGVIRVDASAALEKRLHELHEQLSMAMNLYRPDAVAVEGVFTFRNVRSALILGHARGVALLVSAQHGLPVFEYAPAHVKRSVGAGGSGAKDAVSRMVQRLLQVEIHARADATDALAVALCHMHRARSPVGASASKRSGSRADARAVLGARLTPAYRRPEAAG
jgi:crossover junction endodeoxyribonuclease RuvC